MAINERRQDGQARRYHVWTVGDRLRAAREAVTPDRTRFAEVIEVSPDTVRAYERGETKPKPYILSAWCLATGFDRSWILTGEPPDDNGNGEDVSKNVTLRELSLISSGNPRLLKVAA